MVGQTSFDGKVGGHWSMVGGGRPKWSEESLVPCGSMAVQQQQENLGSLLPAEIRSTPASLNITGPSTNSHIKNLRISVPSPNISPSKTPLPTPTTMGALEGHHLFLFNIDWVEGQVGGIELQFSVLGFPSAAKSLPAGSELYCFRG